MRNDQVTAARRALNPQRATIKVDTGVNDDGSETLTPYVIASPQTRGVSVTVTTDTPASDVERQLRASILGIL